MHSPRTRAVVLTGEGPGGPGPMGPAASCRVEARRRNGSRRLWPCRRRCSPTCTSSTWPRATCAAAWTRRRRSPCSSGRLPPTRGFLVAAGLEPCLAFLEGFRFDEEELDYLGEQLGFEDETLDALPGAAVRGRRLGRARGPGRLRERAAARDHRADRGRPARRDLPAERHHVPDDDRVEGGAVRARRRRARRSWTSRSGGRRASTRRWPSRAASAMVGFAATEQRRGGAPVRAPRRPARWRTPTSSPSRPRRTRSVAFAATSRRAPRSSSTPTTR